jgi:hypothetical protein
MRARGVGNTRRGYPPAMSGMGHGRRGGVDEDRLYILQGNGVRIRDVYAVNTKSDPRAVTIQLKHSGSFRVSARDQDVQEFVRNWNRRDPT